MTTAKTPRSTEDFTDLDAELGEQGTREAF